MIEEQAPVSWVGQRVSVALHREPAPEGALRVSSLVQTSFPQGRLQSVNEFGVTLILLSWQLGPEGGRGPQPMFYPWTSIRSMRLAESNEPVG